jgi:hypothetical protein
MWLRRALTGGPDASAYRSMSRISQHRDELVLSEPWRGWKVRGAAIVDPEEDCADLSEGIRIKFPQEEHARADVGDLF